MSVYYNDIDPYCCKVLRKNIANGNLPGGIVDERDIRDVRASDLVGYNHIHLFAGIGGIPLGLRMANFPESINILTGGFPCQDISIAGKREGITGARSGLWSEMYRLVCDIRPDVILVENVPALLNWGIDRVLGDLAACGYDAEWTCISAASIGAPHIRERVFIVAYPASEQNWRIQQQWVESDLATGSGNVADTLRTRSSPIRNGRNAWSYNTTGTRSQDASNSHITGLEIRTCFGSDSRQKFTSLKRGYSSGSGQWAVESDICRVVDGVPSRVERLRGLGNAVVPQVVQFVAECIIAAIQQDREVAV